VENQKSDCCNPVDVVQAVGGSGIVVLHDSL
jgi:hypothetical protein